MKILPLCESFLYQSPEYCDWNLCVQIKEQDKHHQESTNEQKTVQHTRKSSPDVFGVYNRGTHGRDIDLGGVIFINKG